MVKGRTCIIQLCTAHASRRLTEDCSCLSPTQVFYDIMYADDTAMKVYHAQYNKDPEAWIGSWEANHRSLSFCMPINVPAALQRMIGEIQ